MVVVQFAKVQNLKGKTAIQNMHATRLLFNADIVEMIEFRNKLTELNVESCQPIFVLLHVPSYSLENDFLNLNPMKSLEQLIECKEVNVILTVDVFIHSLC